MPTYFGDIAKTAKDLITGSFSYDNKYSLDVKETPVDGLKLACSAAQKQGASDVTGTVKSTFDVAKGLTLETEAALPGGKVSATASHSGAIDGVKVSVSGDPKDVTSAKIALQILRDAVGVKADVTGAATGAPKAAVNACYDAGDLAIGASADVDCTSGAVSKYALAAQIVADDNTLAVVVADELSTVRGSWVAKVDADTSAGAEVVYGVKSKTASASVALAKKFSDACSGKVSVTSPLPVNGGVVDPVISLYTTGDVAAKTTGSVSFQTTAAMKYKWGVQFATKM